MHCPKCGFQQASEPVKFCTRCGFTLATTELASGTKTMPINDQNRPAENEVEIGKARGKKALKIGVTMVLSTFLVAFLGIVMFWLFDAKNISPKTLIPIFDFIFAILKLTMFTGVVLTLFGMVRFGYASLLGRMARPQTAESQQQSPIEIAGNAEQRALPPSQVSFNPVYANPTEEQVMEHRMPPPSVTEHTTRKLKK